MLPYTIIDSQFGRDDAKALFRSTMMQRMQAIRRFLSVVVFLFCLIPGLSSAATIDVMIVYDSTAKSWVDSNGGMNTFAEDAVARMNQAAANSNIDLTFRLVHAAQVSYTYSGNLGTDLQNLQGGNGNLSVVHDWRDIYGADLVIFLEDTGSAYGWVGVGYLLRSYYGEPDYAFTASAIQSVDISHTMTHEVGHNLGCHHSKYQTSDPGPNWYLSSYSAGWYFTGSNGIKYHTIMAYNSDGHGNYYEEAPLFSTPLLSYEGTAAGDEEDGNNARTIRETMDVVAAYRSSPGVLSVSPSGGLTSSGSQGGPFSPASQSYTLTNIGGSSINWTAAKGQNWTGLSSTSGTLASGASATVTVSINSNASSLAVGSYSDTVSFTNTTNGSGNTTREVSLTVAAASPGALSVSPSSGLTSSGSKGGPFSPASQIYTLTNTGGSSIKWTAAKGRQTWISLSSTSGTLASGASATVTVSINSNANGLPVGSYSSTVTFKNATNGSGNTTREASLTVMLSE